MDTLTAVLGLLLCIGVGLAGVIAYAYSQMTQNDERRRRALQSAESSDASTADFGSLFYEEETPEEKSAPTSESWWDKLSDWFSGSGDSGGDGGADGGGGDGGGGGGGD